jgi:VanZ family protein
MSSTPTPPSPDQQQTRQVTDRPAGRRLAAVVGNAVLWRYLLACLVVAIAWLALTPSPPEQFSTGWDKANHALAFAVLTCSGRFAYPGSKVRLLAVVCAVVAFGGFIEIAQLFVPGRSSDIEDLLADSIGAAIGALLGAVVLRLARGQANR